MDPYQANIWPDDNKMENLAPASSDAPQDCSKSIYVHYKVAQLLHQ